MARFVDPDAVPPVSRCVKRAVNIRRCVRPVSRSACSIDRSVEYARTRRLDAAGEEHNEERRLLEHADAHLRAPLVAALSTGCRVGEMLSLQSSQIDTTTRTRPAGFSFPATKTKSGEMRMIPIGDRLRAELNIRRHAVDGTRRVTMRAQDCVFPLPSRALWQTGRKRIRTRFAQSNFRGRTIGPETALRKSR